MSFPKKEEKILGFVGMRVVKTALAVYICFLISLPRGSSPFYSVISAIISMKNDSADSVDTGISRIIGTLIGGSFGLITILLIGYLGVNLFGHFHYLILSLMLIPLIYSSVKLHSPSSTTIACIVFIGIAISNFENVSPFMFTVDRVIETSIGVLVAVVVNRFL